MRNGVDVPDGAVRQQNSMLDIQVHTVLRGAIPELLQAISVLGGNSVEHEIESRILLSREAQNPVGFVRPNELTTADLPPESSRMTESLSLCQVLPSSLQLTLRSFQIFIGLFQFVCPLSVPGAQDPIGFGERFTAPAPATQQAD